ncbi:MAG: RNA polymerase Rpb4 family protein [Promethearchaeota archaeon]
MTLAEVKRLLLKRGGEDELNYVQRITLDYVNKVTKLTSRDSKKLLKILTSLGISTNTSIQIINSMPTTRGELRVFLSQEANTPSEEEMKKILNKIKEFKD